ncbi:hypothetical protein [Jiella avicenniae]|uniref:Uncharacterized protein n=1 Tax=Jiella avicenniae TaxID=2907202 RepID=A0A9X1P3L9_9HYPH|nr:hypothetical protein [Jiella avicenniae]MCE7027656.1 hypothetical protein [Jiella avicenniae]MCE7028698.1 hypothetical protein [Jiella avicenniae]
MRTRTRLWTTAGGLSLAIHAGLAALALALLPQTARQPARETTITVEEIETRTTSLAPTRASRAEPAPAERVDPTRPAVREVPPAEPSSRADSRTPSPIGPREDGATEPLAAAEPRMRLGPGDSRQQPVALAPSASVAPERAEPTQLSESRPQTMELAAVEPDTAITSTASTSPPVREPASVEPAAPTAIAAAEIEARPARPAAPLPAETPAPRPPVVSEPEALAPTLRLAEVAAPFRPGEAAATAPAVAAPRATPEPLSPRSTGEDPASEPVRPALAERAMVEPQMPEPKAAVASTVAEPDPAIAARARPGAVDPAATGSGTVVQPKSAARIGAVAAPRPALSPTTSGPALRAAPARAPRVASKAPAPRGPQPSKAGPVVPVAAEPAETAALAPVSPIRLQDAPPPVPIVAARPAHAPSVPPDETRLAGETPAGTMAARTAAEVPPDVSAPLVLDGFADQAVRVAATAAVPGRLAETRRATAEAVPAVPLTGQVSGRATAPRVTAKTATASDTPEVAPAVGVDVAASSNPAPASIAPQASTAASLEASTPAADVASAVPVVSPSEPKSGKAAVAVSPVVPSRIAPKGPERVIVTSMGRGEEIALAAPSARRPQTIVGSPAETQEQLEGFDDEQSATLADLVAAYPGGDCFAALTEAGKAAGEFRITALSDDQNRLEDFADTLIEHSPKEAFRRVYIDGGEVAEAQCRALASLPEMPGYPAFGLTLELEKRRIVSGETLAGTISGVPASDTLDLLLVDDEGLVQSLSVHLTRKGATASFDVPVSLSGPETRTAQILIALALPQALIHADGAGGEPAGPFFEELAETLAAKGLKGEFAVGHFLVKSR